MAQQREAHSSRQQVSTTVQDGLRAWGDGRLVRVALAHLLDNAWKFTSSQQKAAITVGATGATDDSDGESTFFVRDSGCGFDSTRAVDLFRKFQRLNPSGPIPGGGVGLVTVGRIIDRHGGRVWADSQPGQGTTVYFTLPQPTPAFSTQLRT